MVSSRKLEPKTLSCFLWVINPTAPANSLTFNPLIWQGSGGFTITEALARVQTPFAIRLVRMSINMIGNTKDGNTIIGIRDDGVTVASRTIAGGDLTDTETDLNIIIAPNSFINQIFDTTLSTLGSIQFVFVVWYERVNPIS